MFQVVCIIKTPSEAWVVCWFLHYWECQQLLARSLWNSHPHMWWDCWFRLPYLSIQLCMSRVLKPFYNTAVSLFYSLIKIVTIVFFPSAVSLSLYISFTPQTNKPTWGKLYSFPYTLFPQVLNKGSKNGYCFSNVCFIFKVFLLLDIKIWC